MPSNRISVILACASIVSATAAVAQRSEPDRGSLRPWQWNRGQPVAASNGAAVNVGGFPGFFTAPVTWINSDPYLSVLRRARDQADLMVSNSEAARRFAEADALHSEARLIDAETRISNARAYQEEVKSWMAKVRARWDSQILAQKKAVELNHAKQIRKLQYLNDRKWNNHRHWDRYRNHPELTGVSVTNGLALNFLLDRLAAVSALPYRFEAEGSRYGDEVLGDLTIQPEWLQYVALKQEGVKFTAADFNNSRIEHWPFFLQWEEFDSARQEYEAARQVIVRESTEEGKAKPVSVKQMQYALSRLSHEFHASTKAKRWASEHRSLTKYKNTSRFLYELDREIRRLEETGDIRPFQSNAGWETTMNDGHIVSFLSFMNRNGIRFAPPESGGEFVYHNLFQMMRALYLTVEDDDVSTRPENLSERFPGEGVTSPE